MNNKLKQIIDGWKNLIWKTPEIETLMKSRAEICSTCETNINNWCDSSKGGCGCPLKAKLRSQTTKCPKEKW